MSAALLCQAVAVLLLALFGAYGDVSEGAEDHHWRDLLVPGAYVYFGVLSLGFFATSVAVTPLLNAAGFSFLSDGPAWYGFARAFLGAVGFKYILAKIGVSFGEIDTGAIYGWVDTSRRNAIQNVLKNNVGHAKYNAQQIAEKLERLDPERLNTLLSQKLGSSTFEQIEERAQQEDDPHYYKALTFAEDAPKEAKAAVDIAS